VSSTAPGNTINRRAKTNRDFFLTSSTGLNQFYLRVVSWLYVWLPTPALTQKVCTYKRRPLRLWRSLPFRYHCLLFVQYPRAAMRYLLAFSLLASFSTQVSALIPVVNVILASNDTPSKCITATNSNGALVTVQACTGTVGQRWTLQNGVVRIPSWNKCLDVKDGVNADGIKLQVWDCPPTFSNPNQQFSIQSPGPSTTLTWVGHNKCVDLTNGNTNDGTQVGDECSLGRVQMLTFFS
jgi:hypothetical protein